MTNAEIASRASFGEICVPGSSCGWEKHESGDGAEEEGAVGEDGSMKYFLFSSCIFLYINKGFLRKNIKSAGEEGPAGKR